MKQTYLPVLAVLVLGSLLQGCSHRNRTVIGGPDAEEAAIRLEESEQEYNDCIAARHVGAANCDSLKALYEKDKAEYEAQVQ
ncbi:hypothetical protein JCM19379_22240 [Methyloparacoccus murrellii]